MDNLKPKEKERGNKNKNPNKKNHHHHSEIFPNWIREDYVSLRWNCNPKLEDFSVLNPPLKQQQQKNSQGKKENSQGRKERKPLNVLHKKKNWNDKYLLSHLHRFFLSFPFPSLSLPSDVLNVSLTHSSFRMMQN